jgi:hypothetical protein
MEALLHHALHLLYFLMPPILMVLAAAFTALARFVRRSPHQPGTITSPRSRYSHALEQQELDLLLDDQEYDHPRRGFSAISLRH